MMNIEVAQNYILSKLESELDPTLFYHGVHHTLDVVQTALTIAYEENVTDAESLDLLRTAALYHDCGFLVTYKGHEAAGCDIAQNVLDEFGYTHAQIATICGLIMSTKVPQSAATHLEKILCDADLDYLGRADFKSIGETLYLELEER
ncbi:MAG TPA: HD domain-containing protein, partial [Dyadobacter sp.]|nr:HD domain-containing protein [Dyadobacter sp.]